jgi:RHH-type proline utilization regulon transcriptional repressor/proline dehydrogenase/delta 1-pyrroline-5-carboxylate dehydrogenase
VTSCRIARASPKALNILCIVEKFVIYDDKAIIENFHSNNEFELSGNWVDVFASSKPEIKVGRIKFAEISDAKLAIETIDNSYNNGKWANSKWPFRTAMLIKAAELMLARRNDLSALIVYEAGKSITEALADVDEAIDFLNFYARSEAYIQRNYTDIISRGPTLVISPWNFPLAIPCGMTVSALVAGNTVILKPAEQTSLVTQVLVDILHEAGVPKDVLIHLPGVGETIGDFLVKDERVSTIIFTGSKAVGLYIANEAQKRIYRNQLFDKAYPVKAITEMGGKNAVIVTQNAELDETVSGILYSAFGHAGQKCSACSRVIVHNSLKDKLLERLNQACQDLKVGESMIFDTSVNPIISKFDAERLKKSAIDAGEEAVKAGGRVVIDRSNEKLPGYCVGPVVIEVPKSLALDKRSFAQKELFGPILHVVGFSTLDEALEIYNSTDYALTGGVFSQSQDDIDYLLTKMESGNIYVNRTITGARVAIEPFGGFKLSGTGPKAGGKHYLLGLHQLLEQGRIFSDETRKIIIEEGGAVDLKIAKSSGLNSVSRKERLEKFLSSIIFNYDSFFSGFNGNHKDVLKDYKKWISKNLVSFIEREHKNRVIPGQLSFNNYQLSADHVLFIVTNDSPSIKTLIQAFSSISMGCGLTIIARNHKSYQLWKNILDVLYQSGFSSENVLIKHVNTSEYKTMINNQLFSHIIFDGEIQELSSQLVNYIDNGSVVGHVKAILTVSDNLKVNDYYHQSLNFVHVRSLAINTMRHGAPLDLEIN